MRPGVRNNRTAPRVAAGACLGAAVTFGMLVLPSCGKSDPAGLGSDCLQATDCAEGLVCAPVDGRRICTNDISGIQPPIQNDSSAPDAVAAEAAADAPATDVQPPRDVNVPDTTPPPDAGLDTGAD